MSIKVLKQDNENTITGARPHLKLAFIKKVLDDHGYLEIIEEENINPILINRKSERDIIFFFRKNMYIEHQIVQVKLQIDYQGRTSAKIIKDSFIGIQLSTKRFLPLTIPFFYFDEMDFSELSEHQINSPESLVTAKISFTTERRYKTVYSTFEEIKVVLSLNVIINLLNELYKYPNQKKAIRGISQLLLLIKQKDKSTFKAFFNEELNKLSNKSSKKECKNFIKKWLSIDSNLLTLEDFIKNPVTIPALVKHIAISEIPTHLFDVNTLKKLINNLFIHGLYPLEELSQFQEKLKTIKGGEHLPSLLEKRILLTLPIIETRIYLNDLMSFLKIEKDTASIPKEIIIKCSQKLKIALWFEHKTSDIEEGLLLDVFAKKNTEEILTHFHRLSESFRFKLIQQIDFSAQEELIILEKQIEQFFKDRIPFISFDLEYTDKLHEIGFISNSTKKAYKKENIEDGILDLVSECSKKDVIIGHNILAYDLPILAENFNYRYDTEKIWDTLKIELLLNPTASSYQLKTAHHAKEDAEKSLELFYNQLWRITFLEEAIFDLVIPFMVDDVVTVCRALRKEIGINNQAIKAYATTKNNQLLQAYTDNSLKRILQHTLEKEQGENKIILAPRKLWSFLAKIPALIFWEQKKQIPLNAVVSETAINSTYKGDEFNYKLLKIFLLQNKASGLLPKFSQLSPYVQRQLKKEIQINQICSFYKVEIKNKIPLICGDIDFLLANKTALQSSEQLTIIEIGKNLNQLINKELLASLSYEQFSQLKGIEDLWKNFSGGRSVTTITDAQRKYNGFHGSLDTHYNNFWIEKVNFDQYNIWAKPTYPLISQFFPSAQLLPIAFEDKNNTASVKPIVAKLSSFQLNQLHLIRFNPTTFYRDRYWLFQSFLVKALIHQVKLPTILFISEAREIPLLISYFQSLGFYIPNNSASFIRQFELFHKTPIQRKILIYPISLFEKVLSANNEKKAINIIIDSFNLEDGAFTPHETIIVEKEDTINSLASELNYKNGEEDSVEDPQEGNSPAQLLLNDTGKKLELISPLINYYKFLVANNNINHELSFLDPRIDDYFSIKKKWHCQSLKVELWNKEEFWQEDLAQLRNFFSPTVIEDNNPIDIAESMDKIQNVFLPKGKTFYEHQIPYLKAILKAEKDLLIMLPTGGGKSVLFQGPALYRSSIYRRLTLVITPLKALMDNQVQKLWDIGFWNSVDYINQDKGREVQNIYRRLAGGEINLLFITPERFRSRSFETALQMRISIDGGLEYCVFDEAHCISQWGNEFRPDYQRSAKISWKIKKGCRKPFPILLFSATISEQIYADFNQLFI